MRYLLLLLFGLGCCAGCTETKTTSFPPPISEFDEQAMDAAIARARLEVDSFIAELKNPTGERHAVKIPISGNGEVEHFWMTELTYQTANLSA